MQSHQKRGKRLSSLVIRSLGVLVITLIAMTSSPATSTAVPNCSQCDGLAHTWCPTQCDDRDGNGCLPLNVSFFCQQNCPYEWVCTGRPCVDEDRNPGERLECTLVPQL